MGLVVISQPEGPSVVKAGPHLAEESKVSTSAPCRQCGAPLRPDQDWCSLCYATVEAAFDPLTAPLHQVETMAAPPDSSAVEDEVPAAPTSAARPPEPALLPVQSTDLQSGDLRAGDPIAGDVAVSDVDVMLSMLAAEHRQSDPTAGLAERLEDRSTRIAVMVGGTALIGGVLFLVLTLLGALV